MSRHIDPDVEERILQAARKLWHKGGEDALNMRAVAKAAGTNTPAVYRRFRNREEILRALVSYYQQETFKVFQHCHSLEELGQAYIDFVLSHPREYLLMNSGLMGVSKERPNLDFVIARSSEWMGGARRARAPGVCALGHVAWDGHAQGFGQRSGGGLSQTARGVHSGHRCAGRQREEASHLGLRGKS